MHRGSRRSSVPERDSDRAPVRNCRDLMRTRPVVGIVGEIRGRSSPAGWSARRSVRRGRTSVPQDEPLLKP